MKASTNDQRVQPVSLKPSDARKADPGELGGEPDDDLEIDPRPTLTDVKRFTFKKAPPDQRDEDRLSLMFPKLVHAAVEMLDTRAHVNNQNTVALWALDRGLTRVHLMPDVRTVVAIRKHLAEAGADDGQYEWIYKAGAGMRERMDIRHVGARKARFVELRRGLHLQGATLGTIVMMAGLVDAPIASGLAEPMRLELTEFQRRLEQQVRIMQSIYNDVTNQPKQNHSENQLSWSQVCRK